MNTEHVMSCVCQSQLDGIRAYSKQKTTDNPAEVTASAAQLRHAGTIVVEMWRGKQGSSLGQGPVSIAKSEIGVMHEKSKKLSLLSFRLRDVSALTVSGSLGALGQPEQVRFSLFQ